MNNITDLQSVFESVSRSLKGEKWFKKDGWMVSIHPYPASKPDGVTLHVFKKNWLNEDRKGIHIESYLALDLRKRRRTYIALHILHHDKIPGTTLKRIILSKPIVDDIIDTVRDWSGYEIRAGKYGQQPFGKILDGVDDAFPKDLLLEINQLCRIVGPVVDRMLELHL